MVFRFYPTKDATLYERYPAKNTGMDPVLELSKQIVGTQLSSSIYNSRPLVGFDYAAIEATTAAFGYSVNTGRWLLKLYACEVEEIPSSYAVECYIVSQSWFMGTGKTANIPITTAGVSWVYRDTAAVTSSAWPTGSYTGLDTGSWTTNPGGGVWFPGHVGSQSFDYSTADLAINVSEHMSGIFGNVEIYAPNNLFSLILKRSDADEQSNVSLGSVKFFSRDTSTVFSPVLEFQPPLRAVYTGSLGFIDVSSQYSLIPTNLQASYNEDNTATIRFVARAKYPTRAFVTSSLITTRQLVSGSRYAIYSAQSDDEVIGFSESTTLSHDDEGNYFLFHMDSLQPERYYRILIQVPNAGKPFYGHQVFDNNWIFKVSRLDD